MEVVEQNDEVVGGRSAGAVPRRGGDCGIPRRVRVLRLHSITVVMSDLRVG